MNKEALRYIMGLKYLELNGYYFTIGTVDIDNSTDSKAFMRDIQSLLQRYAIYDTFSFATNYIDLDTVINFGPQMTQQLISALTTVTLVVLFITFNLKVTIFIVAVVLLVILYIAGIIYFWDLTLNSFTGMNMIFALGISIDYSIHVAHKYLIV